MSDSTNAFPPLFLRSGSGESYEDGFCVMQAVDWFAGGTGHTDAPECACDVLALYAIRLNDKLDDEQRQELKKLVAPLVGTKSPNHRAARLHLIVRRTAHEIVAAMFDEDFPSHAADIRAANTMQEIRRAAADAVEVADAARAAASAAAYARATAARVAAHYAHYATYAHYAAATLADDAARAAASHFDSKSILAIQISILEEAIRMGPNGGDELAPFAERISDLIERGYAKEVA